jgi:hypothetical protein
MTDQSKEKNKETKVKKGETGNRFKKIEADYEMPFEDIILPSFIMDVPKGSTNISDLS